MSTDDPRSIASYREFGSAKELVAALAELPEKPSGWRYEVQQGPDGEEAYSWVYDPAGELVCVAKTHHAVAIVRAMEHDQFPLLVVEPGPVA